MLKDCPTTRGSLEEAIADGAFAPEVVAQRTGSFSRSGASELLSLVRLMVCDAPRSEWGRAEIILEGGHEVILRAPLEATDMAKTTDVNADGLLDVILEHGASGAGGSVEVAWVATFAQARLSILADLGEVYADGCGHFPDASRDTTLTWVVVGPSPAFRQPPSPTRTPC